jgi:hypothetical protein
MGDSKLSFFFARPLEEVNGINITVILGNKWHFSATVQ